METTLTQQDGCTVLRLDGRLDAVAAEAVRSRLLQTAQGTSRLALDCRGMNYISSAGLRVLMLTARAMQQKGGKLAIASLTPMVHEIFEVSGFLQLLDVFDDLASAVAALQA